MAVKESLYVCRIHLRALFHTPLFYAYLCLFFVYFYHLNKPAVILQQEIGLQFNAWGYTVGVFSASLSTVVFGLGIVMILSDLPLFRGNSLFETVRCSRNVWISGRILYILAVSVFYTFFMAAICVLTSRGALNDSERWGKLLNTLANGYTIGDWPVQVELSITLTGMFNPLQAFGVSLLTCILGSFCLGLVMLFLSLLSGRTLALIGGSILSILDYLISLHLPYVLYHFSPFSLTRLSIICNPDMQYYPAFSTALAILIVSGVILTGLCVWISHRSNRFANEVLKTQF
jgi:hypothetical protein